MEKEVIRIKYHSDEIDKLTFVDGKSDWIDLRSAEHVVLKKGEFKLIKLSNCCRSSIIVEGAVLIGEKAVIDVMKLNALEF